MPTLNSFLSIRRFGPLLPRHRPTYCLIYFMCPSILRGECLSENKIKHSTSVRKRVIRLLQYGLAIIPFIWIASTIKLDDLASAFRNTAWWTIPLAAVIGVILITLHGVRWWFLVRAFVPGLKLSQALTFHYIGAFYSTVLPSGLAQDIVRGALISRHVDYKSVWGATWIFKLMGMMAWVIILFLALPFLGISILDTKTRIALAGGVVILILMIGVSFSKKFSRPFRMVGNAFPSIPLLGAFKNIRQSIYEYRAHPRTLTAVFVLTLFTQFASVFGVALCLYGISQRWFLAQCMVFLPSIEFVTTVIPITPNGMGIREGMIALMFKTLGLSPAEIGIYIALNFLGPLVKLACGIFVLFERKSSRLEVAERSRQDPPGAV